MKYFGLSCAHPVQFMLKSTEYHDMRIWCKNILIRLLLSIFHQFLAITKRWPILYFLTDLFPLVDIAITAQFMV